jgi:predicted HicB family RNase H-like nuclease
MRQIRPAPPRRKFTLRFDDRLAEPLEQAARENGHSLNAEIIQRLRRSFEGYRR